MNSLWMGDFGVKILIKYIYVGVRHHLNSFVHAKHTYAVHASVPDAYAQCTHKFLMQSAQCMHQFLMRMLSARICS
jgi:hypothetical protein